MRLLLVLVGCATTYNVRPLPLPGTAPVMMDYLAYDRAHHRVWVPAGNSGKVDVIDTRSNRLVSIDGYATKEVERNGKKRVVGPSSATVGDGMVYVGNRADSTVCAVASDSLKKEGCVTLDSMPDGLAWVGSTKEVWVTAPRDNSIIVLDVATPGAPAVKSKFTLEGQPEGFAVDDARGVFYTNLEDKDRTLAIEIQGRKVRSTWLPACGEDGPKGLAIDHALGLLLVACNDKVKVLDASGKIVSSIDAGDGVDNIDYLEARHQLYVAAARAARLTVAGMDAQGKLTSQATVPTKKGARNAVVTEAGSAYVADSPDGQILLVAAKR